jgi:hypothetical protein
MAESADVSGRRLRFWGLPGVAFVAVGALLLSPIPATAQDDAATDPSASAVEVDPSTSAEPRASSGADAVPSVEPGVSASPAVSGVPAAVESQEPAVVVDSPTSSQGVVDAAVLGRVSVMGLAAIGGKPLVGARVRSVRKLNGKRLRFAGKPARTDANGGFVTELRGNKLPKKFEVTIGGGRYHGKRYRGVVKAFGARKDMGQYVNEATTLAVYLQRLSGVSVKRSLRWTADYLCMPDPGKQMFGLGQYGDTKFSDYSPKKLIRAAKRHGGTKKYLRAQARDRVNGTDHHCYKPKKYSRIGRLSHPFKQQASQGISGAEVRAKKETSFGGDDNRNWFRKKFDAGLSAIGGGIGNAITSNTCFIGAKVMSAVDMVVDCKSTSDRQKEVQQTLAKIGIQLNDISSKLDSVEGLLDDLELQRAYEASKLGQLRANIRNWQLGMELLASGAVQVRPISEQPPEATVGQICLAAYSHSELVPTTTQTPFSVCNEVGRIAGQFQNEWANDIVTSLTGLGRDDGSPGPELLIPAVQKVAIKDAGKGGLGKMLLGSGVIDNVSEIGAGFVSMQMTAFSYLLAWQGFTEKWKGTAKSPCVAPPASYSPDEPRPVNFGELCTTVLAVSLTVSAQAQISGNGPVSVPGSALIPTTGEMKGWAWWRYAVDLTGSQKSLPKSGGRQPQWPFFSGYGDDKYVTKVMDKIVAADNGSNPILISKKSDRKFALGNQKEYEPLIGFLKDVKSDPGLSHKNYNGRLSNLGFQGPNMGIGSKRGQPMHYAFLGHGATKATFKTNLTYPGIALSRSFRWYNWGGGYEVGASCDTNNARNQYHIYNWPWAKGLYGCKIVDSAFIGGETGAVKGFWSTSYYDMTTEKKPNSQRCKDLKDHQKWGAYPTDASLCTGPFYGNGIYIFNEPDLARAAYGLMVNKEGALWEKAKYLLWKQQTVPSLFEQA